jgi:hypothetical protein
VANSKSVIAQIMLAQAVYAIKAVSLISAFVLVIWRFKDQHQTIRIRRVRRVTVAALHSSANS